MAQKDSAPKPAEKVEVTKYDVAKLRECCFSVLGVTSSTFDGAFYGLEGQYSLDEAKDIIAKFLNKEVK